MRSQPERTSGWRLRSGYAALFAALGMMLAPAVRADGDEPAERIIREHLQELGAEVDEPAARVFLQQGQSVVRAEQLGPGCTGFLAFGSGNVRDVDLALMGQGGLVLDEDALVAPFAYVRACATQPTPVFVGVSMYAGRGELQILRLQDAPVSVGLLPERIGLAPQSAGPPERPRAVGPSLPQPSVDERLEQADAEWIERGYILAAAPLRGGMGGGLSRVEVPLESGYCYAVVARSEPSRRTAVAVVDSQGERWGAASQGASATAYVCPHESEEHAVLVRAEPGGSSAHVRAFVETHAAAAPLPEPVPDHARVLSGELIGGFERLGLGSRLLGEGWVDGVASLHWPVELHAGHCYAHAALALSEVSRASLSLALASPEGRLLARDRAREGAARVYHCAERSGTYSVVLGAKAEVGRVAVFEGGRAVTHAKESSNAAD